MLRTAKRKLSSALLRQFLRGSEQFSVERSQGFTLIEVLVSIILLTTFMSVTMATLVTASLVKLRANGLTTVTNWIEEDLEEVRLQASLISYTSNTSRCNATSTDTGFADALKDVLDGGQVPVARGGRQTVGSKTYTLTRQSNIVATAPFEVLRLTYTVTDSGSNSTFTTTYTEVVPNAAFECPRF